MLSNIYDLERMAQHLPNERVTAAENERQARFARQVISASRDHEGRQPATSNESPLVGILASRILQLLRGYSTRNG